MLTVNHSLRNDGCIDMTECGNAITLDYS